MQCSFNKYVNVEFIVYMTCFREKYLHQRGARFVSGQESGKGSFRRGQESVRKLTSKEDHINLDSKHTFIPLNKLYIFSSML
jgi:hypothetical protein